MKKSTIIILALFSLLTVIQGFAQVYDDLPLPFLEQWNSGTFETNNWLTEGDNWSINWQEGQPSPSAQFTWDPIQTDYQIALESHFLLADAMTEGRIYLDFDIRLDDVNPTGNEEMYIQVWNWESLVWHTVSNYSNEDGSFDWMSEHIDITDQTMGKVFKIRFAAIGENSLDILAWYVDNLSIYRDCLAPVNLDAWGSWQYQGIVLEWEAHKPDKWIHWDDGLNSGNSIGTGSEIEFDVASRWIPSQLADYVGFELTQIAFFPAEAQASYNVRVWVGSNAANLVVDQPVVDPVIDHWNYITLDSSLMIDISKELWVGYYVSTPTGYPAGVDNGPAIDGFGNMMNFEGWQTLLQINPSLDYNWNIRAFIQKSPAAPDPELFMIHRRDNNNWFFLNYADTNFFVDDSVCGPGISGHSYKVSALYINGSDTCESGFSNEADEICIGLEETGIGSSIKIYPNPASDVLFIESSEQIESVSVFDSKGGQVIRWSGGQVIRWSGDQVKMEIPVKVLVPGLYLVLVETKSGVVGRKVVVR